MLMFFRKKYPGLGMMGGIDKRVLTINFNAIDKKLKRISEAVKIEHLHFKSFQTPLSNSDKETCSFYNISYIS